MAFSLRKYLAELLKVEKISDEEVRKELDELKVDNELEALTRDGHVAANPEAQALARKAITGQASAEEIKQLLATPRPAPAQATIITPPSGPTDEADSTEAAIQAEMSKSGTPYHVAARTVSQGGSLVTGGTD